MAIREFVEEMDLVTCGPEANLGQVAKLMEDNDIGSILVVENEKPVGVITDRDIVVRCLSKHGEHGKCNAKDHMSSPVTCVSADSGIHDVISTMKEKGVRRVVIVDEEEAPMGLVSLGDVLRLVAMEMTEVAEGIAPKKEKLTGKKKGAAA